MNNNENTISEPTPSFPEQARDRIQKGDRIITTMGMEILLVESGMAKVSMKIRDDHLNAANMCHGGAIFCLADVAFALACNSFGYISVGLEIAANYLRPAFIGETLTAEAVMLHSGKQTGVYTVKVTSDNGKNIAFFKATSFRLPDEYLTGKK